VNLVDRYMGAVALSLPVDRREEITRELRANILDRIESLTEEQGRMTSQSEIAEILRGMGHPRQVAARFLPPQRLVGEELFPLYKEALYYILTVILIVHVIKIGASFLSSGHLNIFGLVFGFADTALLAFASVTGIFYVLSNPPKGKPLFTPYQNWNPEGLPPIQRSWQRISTFEQGNEFSTNVFFLLILQYPLWAPADAVNNLSLRFAEPILPLLPLMTGLILMSILLNLWNFRFSYWSTPKLVMSGLINLACALILFVASRSSEVIVLAPGAEANFWGIERMDSGIRVALAIAAAWLLYETVRDFYRVYLMRVKA
jgi:hypothetical protein